MSINNEESSELSNKLIVFFNAINSTGFLNFLRYLTFSLLLAKFLSKAKSDLSKEEEFCKYFSSYKFLN